MRATVWHERYQWHSSSCASLRFLPVTNGLEAPGNPHVFGCHRRRPSQLHPVHLVSGLVAFCKPPHIQCYNCEAETKKMRGIITLKSLFPKRLLLEEVFERMWPCVNSRVGSRHLAAPHPSPDLRVIVLPTLFTVGAIFKSTALTQ